MIIKNGKAGVNVLDRSVFKRIHAVSEKEGRITMSADPVTLPVREIGEYAVYAAINALSAEKILPESFRPVILLPPGTDESRLREIMDQICRVCASQDLTVEGGHTEVTAAVTRPVVIGCCTGVPMETAPKSICPEKPGNTSGLERDRRDGSECGPVSARRIVMTKWAGMEGSCVLAREKKDLEEVFPETILHRMRKLGEYLSVKEEALLCAKEGTAYLTDLSEGGFYAALFRLSQKARRGFRVDLKSVPVLQETIEFANHYDIDPYRMRSAGSLLAVTDDAEALIEALSQRGIPAVGIGELSEDQDKIIRNGEEIRYLDLPQPDELLKLL